MVEKSEFDKYFGDEFFIIDTNNLNEINGKLYGFSLTNGMLVENENYKKQLELTGEGAYVYIGSDDESISIFQDFIGSYGLYLFVDDDYFAISNSFLKLVEYLKEKVKLTLNKEFASSLMASKLCSNIYKETLINEIELLPRNIVVHINKSTKNLRFQHLDYKEKTYDLNSKEALIILDNWFEKWVSVIRFLKEKTNNIQFDLSGGFDSRLIILLLLSANIDLSKVFIRSIDDELHSHKEDFEIASLIAHEFNFELNKKPYVLRKKYFKDINTIISLSAYLKLGFHNQFNFKFYRTDNEFYYFSGVAGESIRSCKEKSLDELKESMWFLNKKENEMFREDCDKIFRRTIKNVLNDFNLVDFKLNELIFSLFFESKWRHHFGKLTIEENFTNQKKLNPLLDPELHKLKLSTDECDDSDLLISLIFVRYCPKLLNFKFEGGRKINPEVISYAEYINKLHPYVPKNYDYISGPEVNLKSQNEEFYHNWDDVNNYLKEIFNSRYFEMDFKKYFSTELYNRISNSIKVEGYFPIQYATPAFAVLKIRDDIKFFDNLDNSDFNNWIRLYHENCSVNEIKPHDMQLLLNFITARIDIKNQTSLNSNNSIEIIEVSDKTSHISCPPWFNQGDGTGIVLTSIKGEVNFKLKCNADGKLIIWLRGIDIKDKNGNRIPIFIHYTKLNINNENILNNDVLVSHDTPYTFSKNVVDSEIIDIYLNWQPLSNACVYK